MTSSGTASAQTTGIESDDSLRTGVYCLLAELFAAPLASEALHRLASVDADPSEGELAEAWARLASAARDTNPQAVDDEYHNLFIGLGRGEVMPFGCWYMTGFLMGRPLVELRRDLERLGLERAEGVHEPEDHIAALFADMALLSDPQTATTPTTQRDFFNAHIGTWIGRFMQDVQAAESARFYRAVGQLGERFSALEQQFLNFTADAHREGIR